VLIATPAAVAIWSGWVGLGGLCGFGPVNLLPGIGGGFTINTAITLPVGVEAYAAYALGAWMSPSSSGRARTFAMWSALGALAYGMLGQVAYHLLAAAGVTVAPWPVVVAVSCMPVAVLGFAAALTHLLRSPLEDERGRDSGTAVGARPGAVPAAQAVTAAVTPGVTVPTVAKIRQRRKCSPATAQKIQAELRLFMKALSDPPAGILPPAGDGSRGGAAPTPRLAATAPAAQDPRAGTDSLPARDRGQDDRSPPSGVLAAPFNGQAHG